MLNRITGKGERIRTTERRKQQNCRKYSGGTVEHLLFSFQENVHAFMDHVFVKRKQSNFVKEKMSNFQPIEAIIQVDFSENYACLHQDEIQSAHWYQEQVTLFPVIWSKNSLHECNCENDVL